MKLWHLINNRNDYPSMAINAMAILTAIGVISGNDNTIFNTMKLEETDASCNENDLYGNG